MSQDLPPAEDSIPALISRLIDDGEQFVRAEIKLYRARALARIAEARNGIILIVIALSLVQAVMVAALVGVLIMLRPVLGPGGATATVVIVGLGIAGMLALVAWRLLLKATDIKDKDTRS